MKKPAPETLAGDTMGVTFSTRVEVPSMIAAEAYGRWQRSFCGKHCVCDECCYKRALPAASNDPALIGLDLEDPSFLKAYREAENVVERVECLRRRRIAFHIARERLGR